MLNCFMLLSLLCFPTYFFSSIPTSCYIFNISYPDAARNVNKKPSHLSQNHVMYMSNCCRDRFVCMCTNNSVLSEAIVKNIMQNAST